MKIDIERDDFGTLCICALRYCHGRQTYMPSLVQKIVRKYLGEFTDKDIAVMVDDCEFLRRNNLYCDEKIDKPNWLAWEKSVKAERDRRAGEQNG